MIKTVKVEKQMHIGELLEYVRKNELRGRYFRVMNESRYIKITPGGAIYFDADFCFRPDDTFTVEVEEPITEDAEFEAFVVITDKGVIKSINNYHNMRAVRGLLENYEVEQKIYALIDNNLQLIWEAE